MRKRLFLFIFTFIGFFSILSFVNQSKASAATACYACPDKTYYGSGLLHDNQDIYDPTYPVDTYPKICIYSGPTYLPPEPNGDICASTQTCDEKDGCVDSGGPLPGNCPQADGRPCQDDTSCGNHEGDCVNVYCVSGDYRVQPGQNGQCLNIKSGDPGLPPGTDPNFTPIPTNLLDAPCTREVQAGDNQGRTEGNCTENSSIRTAIGGVSISTENFIQRVLILQKY